MHITETKTMKKSINNAKALAGQRQEDDDVQGPEDAHA